MIDDLVSTPARTSRKATTNQPPLRQAIPLWEEELATDKSLDAPDEAVFWDTKAIIALAAAVLVGLTIGVPLGVYLYGTS